MSYNDLKKHYELECELMKVECIGCHETYIRKQFKKHQDRTCVKNLIA